MAQADFSKRELLVKLVYYGPALSGKTTNLSALHGYLQDKHRSRLVTLETVGDRTLYFDMLPIACGASLAGGDARWKVLFKLFTVPGQVMHNNTRRILLRGVDGVAFIADSQWKEARANDDAYADLRRNLVDNGLDPERLPVVIQFNKRDLPPEQIRSEEELVQLAETGRETVVTASAIQGVGVRETFLSLVHSTMEYLDETSNVSAHGIRGELILEQLAERLSAQALLAGLGHG